MKIYKAYEPTKKELFIPSLAITRVADKTIRMFRELIKEIKKIDKDKHYVVINEEYAYFEKYIKEMNIKTVVKEKKELPLRTMFIIKGIKE